VITVIVGHSPNKEGSLLIRQQDLPNTTKKYLPFIIHSSTFNQVITDSELKAIPIRANLDNINLLLELHIFLRRETIIP
jgi:hypothetical protein